MIQAAGISCSSTPWYLVHCKPRKESYAASALRTLHGLYVFLPQNKVHFRGEVRQVPFFPGYIFAQADLQQVPRSYINTTPGVIRLVEFGGEPQPIPHYVVETILEQLSKLNTSARQPQHNFCPGDLVRVKHGPLQDLEMVFIGSTTPSKRVRVLLHFLGRLKEVHVDVETLEKMPITSNIQPDLNIQRERYTRGKGRKIKHLA